MQQTAVITRTKNREIFLHRALKSILQQTFRDFTWIIVNDGGIVVPVNDVADNARRQGIETIVYHRKKSFGMEAASNYAICKSQSEYIAIHDDDDSWESDFLQRSVGFLNDNPHYGGVVAWTNIIEENVKEHGIIRKSIRIQECFKTILICDMLEKNLFPPISFLYRRSVIDEIGFYNETFPVTGDYEFNLRFLEKYDIGVIPRPLANHHFRPGIKQAENCYGNSEVSLRHLHLQYDTILRNHFLRRDILRNQVGLGFLLQFNQMHKDSWKMLDKISRSGKELYHFFKQGKIVKVNK